LILRDRDTTANGALNERLYALHDAMSVTAVVNTSGTVQERYGYNGFGHPRYMDSSFGSRGSSSFAWEILFDAYRYDTESGLYQVRYRYLHSKLGRWVSRDPLGEVAFNRSRGISDDRDDLANLFFYLDNRPGAAADPSGLQQIFSGKLKKKPNKPKSYPKPDHPGGGHCPNNPSTTDGCGPKGWKNKLVPNKPLIGVDFKDACDKHDVCYETCEANKEKCDIRFWEDLDEACGKKYAWMHATEPPPMDLQLKLAACKELALTYANAVFSHGQDAYDDAQILACKCKCK
jgi:RHS repeat-associated protein